MSTRKGPYVLFITNDKNFITTAFSNLPKSVCVLRFQNNFQLYFALKLKFCFCVKNKGLLTNHMTPLRGERGL